MTDAAWVLPPRSEDAPPHVRTAVRWWRSLRLRTAAASALLAAVLVASVGLVLAHVTLDGAVRQLQQQAVVQLQAGIATAAFGGPPPAGTTTDPAAIPAALRRAVLSSPRIATFDDGARMWAARSAAPTGVIATRVSNAPVLRQWQVLSSALLWTLLAAGVLAGVVSWIIADRLTARLRAAAANVNRVVLGERHEIRGPRDEVGVMQEALTGTASALARRLDRERTFTADVAHDLRTPLTALVGAAALLDPSPETERVRRQVDRMRRLVEELLELARADIPDEHRPAPVGLRPLVRRALDDLGATEQVRLTAEGDDRIQADPARVTGVVRNLVANALRHGAGPIVVAVEGPVLTVSDHGPGYPGDLLERGPRRFDPSDRATAGTGLGLTIVAQHCRSMRAGLRLANAPGAVATVAFPVHADDPHPG